MDTAAWARVKAVVTDALKLEPPNRAPFVRAQFVNEPELCQEALWLAAQYDPGSTFFADSARPDAPDELDDMRIGQAIGQYVILDRIGRGGMGLVFLARDRKLRRKVALKCLIAAESDVGSERDRILYEAQAAAAISHVNVATVYDVVEHDGRTFIVMEYVEGESLAATMKRAPMPLDLVIAVGRQLAAALAAAHDQDVIHRDLKPANVQITRDGTVKVLDFGVARVSRLPSSAGSAVSTRMGLDQVGAALAGGGTPPYMSPEQLLGRNIDARSDVFSLGIILFEMVTGRRPYAAIDPLMLAEAYANGAPRADVVDRRVPSALADAIANALEVDVTRRCQSARQVGAQLDAIAASSSSPRNDAAVTWPTQVTLVRAAVAVITMLATVIFLGFVSTAVYNLMLGRTGGFASESLLTYLVWGRKTLTLSVVLLAGGATICWVAMIIARWLQTWRPVARMAVRIHAIVVRSPLRAFGDSIILAQIIAIVGVSALCVVLWYYSVLIQSLATYVDTASLESLAALAPDTRQYIQLRFWLAALTAFLSASLVLILRLRARDGVTQGRGGVYGLAGILLIVVLLNDAPYRVFWDTRRERVEYGGHRCYVTGETNERLLLYCADLMPPRNRVVMKNDAGLRLTGVVESIFTRASRD